MCLPEKQCGRVFIMKVYSWETLIVTILVGGAVIIYQVKNIMAGDSLSYFYLIFWICIIIRGLWVSFTSEGYEEDCFRELLYIKATRKLFGSWAPIVTWGGFIIIILAGIIAKLIPTSEYIPIVFLFIGLIYEFAKNPRDFSHGMNWQRFKTI